MDERVDERARHRRRHRQPEPPAGRDHQNAEQEHDTKGHSRKDPLSAYARTVSATMNDAATTMPTASGGAVGRTNRPTRRLLIGGKPAATSELRATRTSITRLDQIVVPTICPMP